LYLFSLKFTAGSYAKRKYLLFFAVSLLTLPINLEKEPLLSPQTKELLEVVKGKIHQVYRQIKTNEHSPGTDYLFNGLDKRSNLERSLQKLEMLNGMSSGEGGVGGGDGGDGVPSILENDNALVVERSGRRPSITQKRIEKWLSGDPKLTMNSSEYRNWVRNRELIDFDHIPEDIVQEILTTYEEHPEKDRKKLFNYFISRRLRLLTESIGDF
jgi:hypothetical protein